MLINSVFKLSILSQSCGRRMSASVSRRPFLSTEMFAGEEMVSSKQKSKRARQILQNHGS